MWVVMSAVCYLALKGKLAIFSLLSHLCEMPNNKPTSINAAKSAMPVILKILSIAFVLLIIIIPVYAFNDGFVYGTDWYLGTDTYMRMVRVSEWVRAISENGVSNSWYGNFSASSNWPYGQTLHWTRPLDIIIVAGALVLTPISGIERGIYYSGVGVSPFLAMLSIIMLFRATRSFLDTRGQVSMAVLLITAPVTKNYFYAARPDHHSLLIFLFAVIFSYLIMMFCKDGDKDDDGKNIKYPIIAGVVAAVAVWTSIEGLVTAAFGAGAIGFIWLLRGRLEDLGKLRWFLWGLALASLIAIGLERPPAQWLWAVEYDRISIPHITLFLLLSLVGEIIWRIWKKKKTNSTNVGHIGRFVGGITLAVLPTIVLFFIFPDFFKGPFSGAMDVRLQEVWLSKIEELRPMFDGDSASYTLAIMHLTPLLWVAWWLKSTWRQPTDITLVIVLGIIIFVLLGVYQVRWAAYLGIVMAVPLASLAQRLFDFSGGPVIGSSLVNGIPGTPIFRVPIVASVFIAPALAALVISNLFTNDTADKNTPSTCNWADMAPALKEIGKQSGRKINIMTRIHEGPEVLYRTGQNVVGTPHHRNTEGILDSFKVLADTDIEESFSILSKRKIDYLAFCKDTIEERDYLNIPGETLTRMMVGGRWPKWLETVQLPSAVSERFYLFRFKGEY